MRMFVGEDFVVGGADDGGGGESSRCRLLVGGAGVVGDDGEVAADRFDGVAAKTP